MDKFNIFGRNHSIVGESSSDLILRCAGKIKILWGNKFIDLLKDGNINVDSKFIFTTKDKIGVKDGIYVLDNGLIYLKVGSLLINLVGEVGNTFVSFLGELKTESNSKYTALKNIGFIYTDLNSIGPDSLLNGIIYIESELKLYIVNNGLLTEYTFKFPNPFTELFIILKNDDKDGALLIKGEGISNSLAFDSFYIFTENGNSYLRSNREINILIDNDTYLNITDSKTTIKNIVQANTFLSIDATRDGGFMLYTDNTGSTLIIDNLIVRNSLNNILTSIYPTYYSSELNVIANVENLSEDTFEYLLTLKYKNIYKVGDLLCIYCDSSTDDNTLLIVKITANITKLDDEENAIHIQTTKELSDCVGKITFLINSTEHIEYKSNSIDLVTDNINARFGKLDDLSLFERKEDVESPINGLGTYSKQGYFTKAGYEKNYSLANDDNSTLFASTEWVRQLINNIVPIGTIIAYHGNTIPDGWAICDGNNGTPNLIGKFIKAGDSELEGGSNEVLLKDTDIPLLNINNDTSTLTLDGFDGKLIPTMDVIEECVVDKGGDKNYCLYTGHSLGEYHLKALHVNDLPNLLNTSGSIGANPDNLTSIKIEPKYYLLVFIMKIV